MIKATQKSVSFIIKSGHDTPNGKVMSPMPTFCSYVIIERTFLINSKKDEQDFTTQTVIAIEG